MEKANIPLAPLRRSLTSAIAKEFPAQSPAPQQVSVHRDLQALIKDAEKLRTSAGDSYVGVHHLLQALAQDGSGKAGKILKEQGLTVAKVRALVAQLRKGRKTESQAEGEGNLEYLKKYGRDLVSLAEAGKLDPVIGRDREIRRVIEVRYRCGICGVGGGLVGRVWLRILTY